MKVLFAVNSESISDAIIKKYQKDYREILSYKNVYYFNAILKEIQKDKSYDRIVISEDLEPFSNNNYESIDKFIFEKLDGISDEAHDAQGNEISIILICSDRHTKGSSFLVKIFGISVYNALLGNDRSMEEVCRLINKPRTKKEAKMYYKIDTDDVNYRAENENEVSELEIQNIISHFKRLGKNTDKYSSSFDKIASQYTEEQLKIIINCLPASVKNVLADRSEKYQEVMSISGNFVKGVNNNNSETRQDQNRTGIKIDIIENKLNQNTKMTKPIVIPNSIKSKGSTSAKTVVSIPQKGAKTEEVKKAVANVKPGKNKTSPKMDGTELTREEKLKLIKAKKLKAAQEAKKAKLESMKSNQIDDDLIIKKDPTVQKKNKVVKPERKQAIPEKKNDELDELEDLELPDINMMSLSKMSNDVGLEDENVKVEAPEKKRRGRPRKTPIEEVTQAPKGKRGRPRKNPIQEEVELDDELEDLDNIELQKQDDLYDNDLLFGLDDDNDELQDELEEETYSDPVQIDELDDLEDLDEFDSDDDDEDEEFIPGVSEESFDEFDDYDEYGEYETTTKINDSEENEELDDLEDLEELDSSDDVEIAGLDDDDDDSLEDDVDLISNYDEDDEFDLGDFADDTESADDSDVEIFTPSYNEKDNDSETLDFDVQDDNSYSNNELESISPTIDYSMSNLNSLLTKDKKIVAFLGSPKNGVSFLVNNLAEIFASIGINTAILDMTQNKNSYYIYTQNEENLRKIAYTSIENLQNGVAEGIKVKSNLTVYTALPNDRKNYSNAEPILSTLVQKHSVVLIDCDFYTNPSYFGNSQEIYLVQSMDILTIQPLTAFLKDLKTQGVLEPEKVRVVINKELKVRGLNNKMIIGGMSCYNDPSMSSMTELFSKDVRYCSIPFEEMAYARYLEAILNCKVSINGYSKNFLNRLKVLGDMVYPLTSRQSYSRGSAPQNYGSSGFSNSMNDTLKKMKKKY